PSGPPGPASPTRGRRLEHPARLWLVAAVILAAIGFLLAKGLGSSLVYFKTVNEAVTSRAQLGTRTFRLEGMVVRGTVRQTAGGVDFTVAGKGVSVPVVNQGSPPQLFQPGIPVVLVGHFQGADFVSNQIMVKHSADYIAAHPNRVKAQNGTTR
ncbi:MAG: cytochrome c maturation protein CcmE, partial [Acidimicrobiales bacterium]